MMQSGVERWTFWTIFGKGGLKTPEPRPLAYGPERVTRRA